MRLGPVTHLHFIGVAGTGMAALAELAAVEGFAVSGCDLVANTRTEHLVDLGVEIRLGHDPSHLEGTEVVVTSSAVPTEVAEVAEARRRGIPVVTRADLLAEVERSKLGIAVSGTHGKTTTAALLTFLLHATDQDPTAVLGGRPAFLRGHARSGDGDLLVYEADEYLGAFLTMRPVWMIITNVEAEHLDSFGGVEQLEAAFVELGSRIPFYGRVFACADDPGAGRVRDRLGSKCLTFGLSDGAWLRATDLEAAPDGWLVNVVRGGERLGRVRVPLAGRHNVQNSLAALGVCLELGVAFEDAAAALDEFSGVGRRLELLGHRRGAVVVDDYAHHPTEVRAALDGARQAWPGRKVVAVFEPHLYSRTQMFADEFASSLAPADVVLVMPIYPAREAPLPGVDSGLVARAIPADRGTRVEQPADDEQALGLLDDILRDNHLLLTLGAGTIDRIGRTWLEGAS